MSTYRTELCRGPIILRHASDIEVGMIVVCWPSATTEVNLNGRTSTASSRAIFVHPD
jgi:hypothetical protein